MVRAQRETSFSKGLAVLSEILDGRHRDAKSIAGELGLPPSTTYRFLQTLVTHGFLVRDHDGYMVGPRITRSLTGAPANQISDLATPYLEILARATGETAVLTIRVAEQCLCAAQVESAEPVRFVFQVGDLLPLYGGAGQRILLAFAPDAVRNRVIEDVLTPFTPNTPTRTELVASLERIRREQVAVSRGELMKGAVAVAVPVIGTSGVIGSLTVAGPKDRCDRSWEINARQHLADVAVLLADAMDEGQLSTNTAAMASFNLEPGFSSPT